MLSVPTADADPGPGPRSVGQPLRQLVDLLRARGALTRAELCEASGLSRTTVSGLVGDLRRSGLVGDAPAAAGVQTGGRPAALVALTDKLGVAVGVDIGRTHLRVVVTDLGHRVVAESECRFDVDGRADAALDAAAELVWGQLAAAGHHRGDVVGVGLGIPAPVDAEGRVGSSNILPGWVGRLPAGDLAARLGTDVTAGNDANLGALAEAIWGAGRGHRHVVYVKVASGIGAGIVVGGRLFRGASGTAGEIGHMTVSDAGAVCRCGNRGCLEMLAGGRALVAQLAQSGLHVDGISELVRLAREGDPGCRRVLADAGDHIGLAVANLVNLLNPEVVVVGGELGTSGELLLGSLRARVHRTAVAPAAACVQVVPAELGDRAEALGAALLVLREPTRDRDPVMVRLAGLAS